MNMILEQYAEELRLQHLKKRIFRFEFEGKFYWLKQPEHPKGSQRLLKLFSQKHFQQEAERLLVLQKGGAPIPQVYVANDKMLVLEDAGKSVSALLSSDALSSEQKQQILDDSAKALVDLHQKNFIHGRPLVKDILWQNGQVRFVDFEAVSHSKNLRWHKIRDSLLFVYGLGRERSLSREQIQNTIKTYRTFADPTQWQEALKIVSRFHWLYPLLLPFKKIAGKDLRAFYCLIENIG
ncbi:hypothetical protein A4G18_05620 [Pasteurellaceae bacterium Pebbles2]|nr:hypothetical protein [Pasteurellaceae bacterium Pebbles2]